MRGSSVKDFRRQANQVAGTTIQAIRPALEGALNNANILKGEVETLQADLSDTNGRLLVLESRAFLADASLWRRLRWLLTGR